MAETIVWKDWLDEKVPSIYYSRDLSESESRGALTLKLCNNWAKKNIPMDKMGEVVKRLSFVVFDRIINKLEDNINPFTFAIIKNSDRIAALSTIKNPIYCMGCAEKLIQGPGNKNIKGTRVTLLGFISDSADAITYGVLTSKGQRINGVTIQESFLSILIRSTLSLDLMAIHESREIKYNIPLEVSRRSDPTSFVYVFGWDPPTNEHTERLVEMPLERLVVDRVTLLCDLYSGKDCGVRPLTKEEEHFANKATIHLLVSLMCWSP
jgi:hypothetical protein